MMDSEEMTNNKKVYGGYSCCSCNEHSVSILHVLFCTCNEHSVSILHILFCTEFVNWEVKTGLGQMGYNNVINNLSPMYKLVG